MDFDLGKAIKKASITAAQAIVSAGLALPVVASALHLAQRLGITITPDQIAAFKIQAVLAGAGVIAWALELARNWVKKKFVNVLLIQKVL